MCTKTLQVLSDKISQQHIKGVEKQQLESL